MWLRGRIAAVADPFSGALTLKAQLLETRVDHRKIVGGSRTSALTPQLFNASADHRKIIGRTGSGHVSSPPSVRRITLVIGYIGSSTTKLAVPLEDWMSHRPAAELRAAVISQRLHMSAIDTGRSLSSGRAQRRPGGRYDAKE
jgi:hypothetical protein